MATDFSILSTTAVWNESLYNHSSIDSYAFLRKLNKEAIIHYLPVIVFLCILMVFGIVGNIIVSVLFCQRRRKSTYDLFILNLALLDLLTCFVGIPIEIADLCFSYTFYAPIACKILRVLESWTSMASALILVIVAIDRYKRICKLGKSFSKKKVKVLCFVAVCLGGLLSWPLFIIIGKKTIDFEVPGIKGVDCSMSDDMKGSKFPLVYYGVLLFCFVLCFVFVVVVYIRISVYIKKTKTTRRKHVEPFDSSFSSTGRQQTTLVSFQSINPEHPHPNNTLCRHDTGQSDSKKSKPTSGVHVTRPTTIFVAITIAFVISFLPFLITMLLRNLIRDFEENLSSSLQVFFKFCLKTFFINNAINPVIYGFLSRQFREDVRRLFQGCVCHH